MNARPVPREELSNPRVEVYVNLLRARERLVHAFQRLFQPHGLSEATYNALRILRGAGEEGLPTQEIGRRLVTRVPDVTRLVDRLETAGLCRRRRSEEDRRVWLVGLTARGRDLLAELDRPVLALHEELLGDLEERQLATLNRLLTRIAEGAG